MPQALARDVAGKQLGPDQEGPEFLDFTWQVGEGVKANESQLCVLGRSLWQHESGGGEYRQEDQAEISALLSGGKKNEVSELLNKKEWQRRKRGQD